MHRLCLRDVTQFDWITHIITFFTEPDVLLKADEPTTTAAGEAADSGTERSKTVPVPKQQPDPSVLTRVFANFYRCAVVFKPRLATAATIGTEGQIAFTIGALKFSTSIFSDISARGFNIAAREAELYVANDGMAPCS